MKSPKESDINRVRLYQLKNEKIPHKLSIKIEDQLSIEELIEIKIQPPEINENDLS